jgi:palmitoyltransferase ZDHHC4
MSTAALALAACVALSAMAVLILGPTERCAHTALGRAYEGVHSGQWLVSALALPLGRARANALARRCQDALCDAPNPFGQAVYVLLVLGGHKSFIDGVQSVHLHSLAWARATSGTFTLALATWIVVCCTDPGVITRENNDVYLAAYEYDDVVYHRKECRTLGVAAPARSKFCTTTKRRVARFDHFCVWVNNTIGANNTRWFLLFLAAQTWLVTYVTGACAYAVWWDLRDRDAWNIVFEGYTKRGERRTIGNDPFDIGRRFIMYHYGAAVLLGVFCAVIGVGLMFFLAYHIRLAATNVTTNEEFKWDVVRDSVEMTKNSKAKVDDTDANDNDGAPADIDWDEIMKNKYDRGILNNFLEVAFPPVPTPSMWRLPCARETSAP